MDNQRPAGPDTPAEGPSDLPPPNPGSAGQKDDKAMSSLQAMPSDGRKGTPDGVNSQAEGVTSDGSMEGARYPNPHSDGDDRESGGFGTGFMSHGGQSDMAYHGSGQLGDEEVEPGGNVNSGNQDG